MKKILSLLLVAVMLLTFAACGAKTDADTDTASKADTESKRTTIVDGKLTMGTNATFPPYEYTDDKGNIIGIDAEIAKAVADKLGLDLEIKDMEFDSLLTAVQSNAIDVVFAGLTVNDERKQAVDFSVTYAQGVQVIIVPEDSKIKDLDGLADAKIGVQTGTTGDIYCTDEFGQDNVKQYANGALAVAALANKQIDCVVIDNEPAKAFVAANKGLKILETEYAVEDYAAAVSKKNPELRDAIDKAMDELKKDGTIDGIIAKYIKAE